MGTEQPVTNDLSCSFSFFLQPDEAVLGPFWARMPTIKIFRQILHFAGVSVAHNPAAWIKSRGNAKWQQRIEDTNTLTTKRKYETFLLYF